MSAASVEASSLAPEPTVALEAAVPDQQTAPVGRERSDVRRSLSHPRMVALLAGLTGALALVAYLPAVRSLLDAFLAVVLVVLASVDLEHRVIPNRIVLPSSGVVLLIQLAVSPGRIAEFVVAGLLAALFFLVPNLINRSAVGMGDVKLALLVGLGLGWPVLVAVCVAFLALFPFAIATLVRGGAAARKTTLPFGPFLAFGALVAMILPRILGG